MSSDNVRYRPWISPEQMKIAKIRKTNTSTITPSYKAYNSKYSGYRVRMYRIPESWPWHFRWCRWAPLPGWWSCPSESWQRSACHLSDAEPNEASIPSGCCSRSVYDHLPAASQQISDAAGPAEYPPCPTACDKPQHNQFELWQPDKKRQSSTLLGAESWTLLFGKVSPNFELEMCVAAQNCQRTQPNEYILAFQITQESRSLNLVPTPSQCTSFYYWSIVILTLSRTISEIRWPIG